MSSELIAWLAQTALATSVAMLLVLLLRKPMRTAFGAGAAYALWALVPIALVAVLLPAPVRPVVPMPTAAKVDVVQALAAAPVESSVPWIPVLIAAWAAGAMAMMFLQLWQQRRFLRRIGPLRVHANGLHVAASSVGLPAVTGVLRPRIVLPADFLSRYSADERTLVVAHERQHIASGDLPCNALVALLRCVYWFNPLLHWAVARYRHDQELACDARVLRCHPRARRAYAQAMLKTQLDAFALPVGCHWHTHPIKERIAMLKRPSPRRWQRGLSSVLLLALFAGGGYAAWAQQPVASPEAQRPVDASPQFYGAMLQVDVNDERHSFEMRSPAHAPFSFSLDTKSGHHWEGTLSVAPYAPGQAKVDIALKRDGEEMSSPIMIVTRLDEEASVKVEPGAAAHATATALALSVRIHELTRQASTPTAHREAPAPRPQTQQVAEKRSAKAEDIASSFDHSQHQPPQYPKEAANAGITGTVVMQVDVAVDGSVQNVQVERSANDERLDLAAIEAVRKWRFKPKLEGGKAAAYQVRVPIEFSMDPPAAPKQESSAKKSNVVWHTPDPGAGIEQFSCDQTKGSNPDQMACGIHAPAKADQAAAPAPGRQILVDVAADGTVSNVRLDTDRKPTQLDRAAMKAIAASRLKPAMEDGRAVAGTVALDMVPAPPGFMAGR